MTYKCFKFFEFFMRSWIAELKFCKNCRLNYKCYQIHDCLMCFNRIMHWSNVCINSQICFFVIDWQCKCFDFIECWHKKIFCLISSLKSTKNEFEIKLWLTAESYIYNFANNCLLSAFDECECEFVLWLKRTLKLYIFISRLMSMFTNDRKLTSIFRDFRSQNVVDEKNVYCLLKNFYNTSNSH